MTWTDPTHSRSHLLSKFHSTCRLDHPFTQTSVALSTWLGVWNIWDHIKVANFKLSNYLVLSFSFLFQMVSELSVQDICRRHVALKSSSFFFCHSFAGWEAGLGTQHSPSNGLLLQHRCLSKMARAHHGHDQGQFWGEQVRWERWAQIVIEVDW